MKKCKIVNGRRVCRKNSYNPFKMWGSYVGAIIGLISIILVYLVNNIEFTRKIFIFSWLFPSTTSGGLCDIFPSWCGGDVIGYAIASVVMGSLLQIIIGFLVGWGIHSLIRRVKK